MYEFAKLVTTFFCEDTLGVLLYGLVPKCHHLMDIIGYGTSLKKEGCLIGTGSSGNF